MNESDHIEDNQPAFNHPENRPYRLAVAEDDRDMRRLLVYNLRKEGYDVIECADGNALIKTVRQSHADDKLAIDLIITDIQMPEYTGLEFFSMAQKNDWKIPVIMITAFGDENTLKEAIDMGIRRLLVKPFDVDKLIEEVKLALHLSHSKNDRIN